MEHAAENAAVDAAEENFVFEDDAVTEHSDRYQTMEDNAEGSGGEGSGGEGSSK